MDFGNKSFELNASFFFQYSISSTGMVPASMLLSLCKQATWKEIHVI